MEKFQYPQHLVRCINTRPSERGKSIFLTTLFLNIPNVLKYTYIHLVYIKIYIKVN